MRPRMNQNARHAFTLIELLLVLVILGILAAVVVPQYVNRSKTAKITAAKTDISNLSAALNVFDNDNGRFPTNEEGLDALVTQPGGDSSDWKGPYIERGVPKDPWGNPYVYHEPGTHNPKSFDLFSTGPGGTDGSGNEINNWASTK